MNGDKKCRCCNDSVDTASFSHSPTANTKTILGRIVCSLFCIAHDVIRLNRVCVSVRNPCDMGSKPDNVILLERFENFSSMYYLCESIGSGFFIFFKNIVMMILPVGTVGRYT